MFAPQIFFLRVNLPHIKGLIAFLAHLFPLNIILHRYDTVDCTHAQSALYVIMYLTRRDEV